MKTSSVKMGPEIEKHNFIYFGLGDWRDWDRDGFCTRSGAVARELARHPRTNLLIVVGNSTGILTHFSRRIRRARASEKWPRVYSSAWATVYRVDHNVLLIAPRKLAPREEGYAVAFEVNRLAHDNFLRKLIHRVVADFGGGKKTVVWMANPLKAHWLRTLDEDVSVFDSIEDLRQHPAMRRVAGLIDRGYRQARVRAGKVFAVSRPMVELLSVGRKEPAVLVSNGLHSDAFSTGDGCPEDLVSIERPIAGYVGNLQERIDVGLLEKLALEAPHLSQVLVGPETAPRHFNRLKSHRNIHLLGKKPHGSIPSYIRHFDICLLPHTDDRFTASMNPLKIYEYLAAGKQVVASYPVDLRDFRSGVTVAPEADCFVSEVKRLAEGGGQGDDKLAEYVLANFSWRSIVDRMRSAALKEEVRHGV